MQFFGGVELLYNTATILLHLTTILIGILLVFIIRMKKKQEIHFISIALISSIFIWCAGMLAQAYSIVFFGYKGMVFTNTYFTAVGFVSVLIFLLGLSFSSGSIKQPGIICCLFCRPSILYLYGQMTYIICSL